MTNNELRSYLNSIYHYDFLVFSDLASELTTTTKLFKTLNAVAKELFGPNERIVFYTSQLPTDSMLKHLHQCMQLLNVGGFFCVLCCPYDIKDRVAQYADPICTIQIGLDQTELLLDTVTVPDTCCPLPWMHLEVKHAGDIYPCCVYQNSIASAQDSTLEQALHSAPMTRLRTDFMSGVKPVGCQHCWTLEDRGLTSNRQWHVAHLSKNWYSTYFDDIKIRSLDIKPGNVCNFKCRICNPVNSSLFADEVKNVISIKTGRWVEYNDYTWKELEALLPNIENLDFYGGEPFLIKQIPKLLQLAVEKDYAKNIRLHINSNGSIFPTSLISTLLQFKMMDIALSIDNIGNRFELERGGVWSDIEQNILAFKQLKSDQFGVYLMPTINIQNVYYLDELIDWADVNDISVTLNFLDSPTWASIDSMTAAAQQLVIDKFKNSRNVDLQNIATRIAHSPGSNGIEFVKRMKQFDSIRNQNFLHTHSAIAQAMGY